MFDEPRTAQHSLMQDPAFAQALRLCGQAPTHLPGGLMVLQRRMFGLQINMVPRAVPPPDLPDQLRAVDLHRSLVILSPEVTCPLPRSLRVCKPRHTALWDLTRPLDALRSGLHPKWRNQLGKAERGPLRVQRRRLRADPATPVLRQAEVQARDRRYQLWPAPLTAAFAKAAPDQTHLFRACVGKEEVGHMLFLSHGDRATYHLGWISEQGKAHAAHNLLMWHAAKTFQRSGHTALDLGLVDGQTPSLDRFKLRTGARRVQTGGTHLFWTPWARD